MKNKKNIGSFLYLAVLMVIIIAVFSAISSGSKPKSVTYAELVNLFKEEQVTEFEMVGAKVSCKLKDNSIVTHTIVSFSLFQSTIIDKYVIPQQEAGIIKNYDFSEGFTIPWWVSFIPYLLLFGAIILVWWYTTKQMNGKNGGGFAKVRVKMGSDEKKTVKPLPMSRVPTRKRKNLKKSLTFSKRPENILKSARVSPKAFCL